MRISQRVHITELRLTNWRNFRQVVLPLEPRVFVIGPNASGKSNLLDGLRFLRDIAADAGGLQYACQTRGGFTSIRSLHARNKPQVSLGVAVRTESGVERYDLTLGQGAKGRAQVKEERFSGNGARTVVRDLSNEDAEERSQTWLEQRGKTKEHRELSHFLASIEYSHAVPQVIREQRKPLDRAQRDPYGSGLIEEMALTPLREQRRRLRLIKDALLTVLPQFEDLTLDHDKTGRPHLVGRYRHWRGPSARQLEAQFSDGSLRLIGLLWSLTGSGGPLLLEEPEISLHEAVVRQLPAVISRVVRQTGRQILITSHSESILADGGIEPREVVILRPSSEDTQVTLGSEDQQLVSLARRGLPFGRDAIGMTAPVGAVQLSLFGK